MVMKQVVGRSQKGHSGNGELGVHSIATCDFGTPAARAECLEHSIRLAGSGELYDYSKDTP